MRTAACCVIPWCRALCFPENDHLQNDKCSNFCRGDGLLANEAYGRISRAYENLRKSGSKVKLGTVESRLQTLECNWAKFESHHDKMVMGVSSDTLAALDYSRQGIQELAEEAFLQQKSQFLDHIRELKSQDKVRDAESNERSIDTTSPKPRTTLPKIQLPQFSGKYEDWPSFRDLFESIIGKDSSLSYVEKLHYLRSCLKGEAELLVRNLPTTHENYEPAWRTLRDYYENKRLLVRAYLASFVSLPKMKSKSAAEMRKVLHGFRTVSSSLESIGRPITSSEDLFVYLTVELLDHRSRREWETTVGETSEPPSFRDLLCFLDKRLHTLEAIPPAKTDSANQKSSGAQSAVKSTRSHHARKQESKIEEKRGRCSLCSKDHFVMVCEGYKGKMRAACASTVLDGTR